MHFGKNTLQCGVSRLPAVCYGQTDSMIDDKAICPSTLSVVFDNVRVIRTDPHKLVSNRQLTAVD